MARFDGKKIQGVIGNLVFKNSGDKKSTIIQIKPHIIKQTKASKVTAGVFGQASSLAKMLRMDFISIMSGFYDGGMINRFTTLNRAILDYCYDKATNTYVFEENSFERLEGFELDNKSLLNNYFWLDPEVRIQGTQLSLTIPAFETGKQLKFPGNANTCKVKLTVGQYNFELHRKREEYYTEVNVDLSQGMVPEQVFMFDIAEGCLCVTGIGLEYFYQYNDVKTSLNSKELSPAKLLSAVITPGTFVLPVPPYNPYRSQASKWSFDEALKLNINKDEAEENN